MATQQYRIVSAEESEIHNGPHTEGSRITAQDVLARVEGRGFSPEQVAERYNWKIADVYETLAYYHCSHEELERSEK